MFSFRNGSKISLRVFRIRLYWVGLKQIKGLAGMLNKLERIAKAGSYSEQYWCGRPTFGKSKIKKIHGCPPGRFRLPYYGFQEPANFHSRNPVWRSHCILMQSAFRALLYHIAISGRWALPYHLTQPYLHSMQFNQIRSALSSAIHNYGSQASKLPLGIRHQNLRLPASWSSHRQPDFVSAKMFTTKYSSRYYYSTRIAVNELDRSRPLWDVDFLRGRQRTTRKRREEVGDSRLVA